MAEYSKQLKKATARAWKWLGAEFKFFNEVKEDLEQLKSDISNARQKKESEDIREALRDFRYIGMAERREARYEHAVVEALKGLEGQAGGHEVPRHRWISNLGHDLGGNPRLILGNDRIQRSQE